MYDWRTDEDEEWTGQSSKEMHKPPSRRWLLVVIPVVALLLGGGIYWQINQRIQETTARLTADVLSSHELVQQAIDNQDVELLTSLLSGREPDWTEAQRELVREGYWLDGALFGWEPAGAATNPTVALDREFFEATLTRERQFAIHGENDERMAIQTNEFYRQGDTRWLLSPPESDFWGNQRRIGDENVAITVPERDADFARLVMAGLSQRVAAICPEYIGLCGGGNGPVPVTFSTDPATLLTIADRETFLASQGETVTVPTLSLIGRAADEASEAILVSQYQTYLLTAIIVDWTNYECCDRGLFFLALTDFLLADTYGLSYAVPAEDYLAFAGESTAAGLLPTLFEEPVDSIRPDRWLVYGWTDYMLQARQDIVLPLAINSLSTAADFDAWAQLLPTAVPYDPTLSAQDDNQAMLLTAKQDIALLCTAPVPGIFTYNTLTGRWLEAIPPISAAVRGAKLQPFPNGNGFFAEFPTVVDGEKDWLAYVWQGPDQWVAFDSDAGPDSLQYSGLHDPAGDRLLVYRLDSDRGILDFQILDLQNCSAENCSLRDVDGLPIWSPSGRQSIVMQGANLWRGDENGDSQEQLYRALFPFWLTEDIYGFLRAVRFSDDSGALVAELGVLVAGFGWEPQERLGQIALEDFIRADAADVALRIERAEPHPYLPNTLVITASDEDRRNFYVLEARGLADGQDITMTPLFISEAFPARFHFSRDVRWLGVTTFGDQRTELNFWLLDRQQGRQLPPLAAEFAQVIDDNHWIDWSADGELLLMLSDRQMLVYRPEDNTAVRVDIPYDGCRDAAWITIP